ncbi:MAG: TraM recognition domain-containing protein [Actinophytocola sp.]|nr:TraM recognition domain-containing protein [Actinophytocola sp.]
MRARDVQNVVFFSGGLGLFGWLLQFAPHELPLTRWWPWLVATAAAVLLAAVIVAIRRHPLVRLWLFGAGVVCAGVWLGSSPVPSTTPGEQYWPWLVAAGGVVVVAATGFGAHRHIGSAGTVTRWSNRSRRNRGVASVFQIWRTSSPHAVRKKATQLRPSVRELGFWQRLRVSTKEYATPLAWVGLQRIWSPIEDVTLRIGGPRTGKTGELGGRVIDAPGAVIATSTRTDLIELTGPVRARKGPLHVFNPSGVGDLGSTITFDPLAGCEDPKTATTRAADLLSGVSAPGRDGGDREFWEGQARRALAALMHAAALGGRTMRDVLEWVADPERAEKDVSRFIRRSPETALESDASQFLRMTDKTRSSVCSTIMPALGWLSDATAAAAAQDGEFDVAQLLAERGTVYMLGAEDAQTAPLVTALTGHIAREARRIAGRQPSGRLDPPLTMALDEAALICPIPLDNWTADMGGRNVTIHIAAQSRAQLRQRWGDTGAAAILNNAATLMIFGGSRDQDDLQAYSTLTGERDENVPTFGDDWSVTQHSVRRVPVLTPAQIAQLKAGRAVIIRRGMPPVVGRVPMAWKRREVKAARRAERWAPRVERWQQTFETALDWVAEKLADADERYEQRQAERARRRAQRQAQHADDTYGGGR